MSSELFVIGHEESTKMIFEGRLSPANKKEFIARLISAAPPTSTTSALRLSDDLGIIVDKADITTIQTRGRVFLDKISHKATIIAFSIKQGQLAKIHIRGYGQPLEENATIGLRNIKI